MPDSKSAASGSYRSHLVHSSIVNSASGFVRSSGIGTCSDSPPLKASANRFPELVRRGEDAGAGCTALGDGPGLASGESFRLFGPAERFGASFAGRGAG